MRGATGAAARAASAAACMVPGAGVAGGGVRTPPGVPRTAPDVLPGGGMTSESASCTCLTRCSAFCDDHVSRTSVLHGTMGQGEQLCQLASVT